MHFLQIGLLPLLFVFACSMYSHTGKRALLQIGLLPGQSVGMGDAGMGCFKAAEGLTRVGAQPHCCLTCCCGFKPDHASHFKAPWHVCMP